VAVLNAPRAGLCGLTENPITPPGRKDYTAMSILISILINFLVVILVLYLVNLLPLDGRARQMVRTIVIIIGILSLLRYLIAF
jgi:hypothetical protein